MRTSGGSFSWTLILNSLELRSVLGSRHLSLFSLILSHGLLVLSSLSLSHARWLLGLSPLVHGRASTVGPSADNLLKHDGHPCSLSPWHMAGPMRPPLVTRAASIAGPSVGDLSVHDGHQCSFPHWHMACVRGGWVGGWGDAPAPHHTGAPHGELGGWQTQTRRRQW